MTDRDTHGEALRRAIRWIADQRAVNPGARLADLITEAGQTFDLSPLDQEALFRAVVSAQKPDAGPS